MILAVTLVCSNHPRAREGHSTLHPKWAPNSTVFLTSRLGSLERDAGCNSVSHGLLAGVCLCRHQVSPTASCMWLVKRAELERGRSGAHQPNATVPTLPLFLFPAFKMSLSLSLAFSHPPTKNYAPVITTIYQVPILCQVQSYAVSDLHDNPVRSAFSAHGTKKEIESVGLGACLCGRA